MLHCLEDFRIFKIKYDKSISFFLIEAHRYIDAQVEFAGVNPKKTQSAVETQNGCFLAQVCVCVASFSEEDASCNSGEET